MSGLYAHTDSFSPARALSPQIRNTPELDSQYLAELLAEHQKLGPFMEVLPICNRLLNQDMVKVYHLWCTKAKSHGFSNSQLYSSDSTQLSLDKSGLADYNAVGFL